jgi:hypothetical protein
MARSDAIIPIYQMIHMAHPPIETHGLRVPRQELSAPRAVELGLVLSVQVEILQV